LRVLLADDHALFSEGLTIILNTIIFPSCEVVQARSWTDAAAILEKEKFDILLVDLFMPGRHDWKVELESLVQIAGQAPVCVISASSNRDNIHKVFEFGAKGYIHKSLTSDKMKSALHKVLEGNIFFPNITGVSSPGSNASRKYALVTARQQEILFLLAEGKSNQQIADILRLQESTVKRHVYNICKTLEVRNRGEAVHVARQLGILENF
jgi:DNA-binding NarL/FixJ family response regulator